jgi:hypothetical protein
MSGKNFVYIRKSITFARQFNPIIRKLWQITTVTKANRGRKTFLANFL